MATPAAIAHWLDALAARHLARCTLREVARAIRALSSRYVARRHRLTSATVFGGAGKRAALALYYGPLHFLMVREVVRALGARMPPVRHVLDLGCGTGAAGAAWALATTPPARITGVDRHPWAVAEANWTYRVLQLEGRARQGDVSQVPLRASFDAVVAAFVVNELAEPARQRLLRRLLNASRRGCRVLIVEPVARRLLPWWDTWQQAWIAGGGRADIWPLELDLPPLLAQLDHATGLDHRRVKLRTLWWSGESSRQEPGAPGAESPWPD